MKTYRSEDLASGDVTTAHYQGADILAVAQNVNGEDAVQSESGSVFVPATETLLEYDDDGNMTFNGRFRYMWNGENRYSEEGRWEEILSLDPMLKRLHKGTYFPITGL